MPRFPNGSESNRHRTTRIAGISTEAVGGRVPREARDVEAASDNELRNKVQQRNDRETRLTVDTIPILAVLVSCFSRQLCRLDVPDVCNETHGSCANASQEANPDPVDHSRGRSDITPCNRTNHVGRTRRSAVAALDSILIIVGAASLRSMIRLWKSCRQVLWIEFRGFTGIGVAGAFVGADCLSLTPGAGDR